MRRELVAVCLVGRHLVAVVAGVGGGEIERDCAEREGPREKFQEEDALLPFHANSNSPSLLFLSFLSI